MGAATKPGRLDQPLTARLAAALLRRLAQPALDELADRIDFVHRRIVALEQQQMECMHYAGIWEAGEYQPGDVATHGGVLWFAWKATSDKPGTSSDWQLMVKSSGR